jgi:hypothetical protein
VFVIPQHAVNIIFRLEPMSANEGRVIALMTAYTLLYPAQRPGPKPTTPYFTNLRSLIAGVRTLIVRQPNTVRVPHCEDGEEKSK